MTANSPKREAAFQENVASLANNLTIVTSATAGYATRPAVDVEGIARVLQEHTITSGYDWNEESYSHCRCGAEDVGPSHQAAAVAAYLADVTR